MTATWYDVQELKGLEIRRLLELSHRQQGLEWDGKIGLVFGGPPCQGLSRIGKRDVDDPRNQLIAHFCRLVEKLQPTAFVLENVPDLLLPHPERQSQRAVCTAFNGTELPEP